MRFSCRAVAAWQSAAFEWDCVYAVAFNPPLINRLRRWWRTNSMLWHIHRAIHYTYMFSAIYLWCRRCLYSWCSMPQRHLLYLFFFFGLKSQGAAHYQQIEFPVFSPIFPLHFFSLLLCVFLFLFFCQIVPSSFLAIPVRDDIGDEPSSWKDMYPFSDYLSI